MTDRLWQPDPMSLTPEQDAFLHAGRVALFTTTKRDGSPQVTMVSYAWDGTDVVMSTRSPAAKWANLVRDPRCAVTVTDDLRCLTLYGRAECISADPDRETLTRRVKDSLIPAHAKMLDDALAQGLDNAKRVVVRVVPEQAIGRV